MSEQKLILVTNDDGFNARGIQSIIDVVRPYGKVVVVAPDRSQSGKSHAVTLAEPLFLNKITEEKDYQLFACSGSPADCVKIALHEVLDRMPDMVVSGINHGSNAAINAIYSGTVAGATEGAFHGIPSLAFSLTNHSPNADFSAAKVFCKKIFEKTLSDGLPAGISLNVNIPDIPLEEIKGMKTCRMTNGRWVEEFEHRVSPHKRNYYWLTGEFKNAEPNAEDTDEWLLDNGYVSIVPIRSDLTAYDVMKQMGKFDEMNLDSVSADINNG